MRRSYIFAILLAVGAVVWMASGQLGAPRQPARAALAQAPREAPPVAVRVSRIVPTTRTRSIRVTGLTSVSREVRLRAETAGRMAAIEIKQGAPVAAGQVIARMAQDERPAMLAEARALMAQRQIEYRAASELTKKGFTAEIKLAETKTALDAAKALLDRIQTDIDRTVIHAPFHGVLAERKLELGGYVKAGDEMGRVIDLDPLLVVGHVTEREVASVRVGMTGKAELIDGRTVEGAVRFVSSTAEPNTRTFRVELEVGNPQGTIRDGLTAVLDLPIEPMHAYRISSSLLSLSDDGVVGVKTVTDDNIVRFVPIRILKNAADHMWIAGLPDPATVITVGHQFVRHGQKVRPVLAAVEGTS